MIPTPVTPGQLAGGGDRRHVMLGSFVVRGLAVVAMGSTLLVACGSEPPPASEGAENPSPGYDQASAVLTDYVEALRAEDVDAAIGFRCRAARPEAHLVDQFASELRELEGLIGSIDGVETRPVTSRLQPVDALPDPIHVGYRVVVDGNVADEMVAVTVVEDGQRRLCGHATAVSATWAETLPAQLTPRPATSAQLVELMPDVAPPGSVQVEDQQVPVDEVVDARPGLAACWTRAWQHGSSGGSRVDAYRFDTEQHAVDAAHSLLRPRSADAVATFPVRDIPGAVGLRVMSSSWLLVQPPNLGPMFESVTIVYGTTVVEIKVTDQPQGREAASGLAEQWNAAATTSEPR